MNRSTAVVALVAGLAGGVLSRYLSPAPVFAQQAQAPNPAPVELRAQRFVLVYPNGTVAGTFTTGPDQQTLEFGPSIRLFDPKGQELWRVGGNPVRPLALK